MQLVIAEKPSVARDLARVLGVRASGRSCFEGAGRVITWCIGHLVELEEPAAYDGRWKAWRLDTLPMLPPRFELRAVAGTAAQFRVVRDLLRDRRFSEVVNACDAGREGELIFRYVHQLAGSRLPVRRLWISSMTDEAIRRGFAALEPGARFDALSDAARCRSEADWLVGMNATRAVTLSKRGPSSGRRRGGKPVVYSIGRVQTPTLALVVRRDREIERFVPRDYWEVHGRLSTDDGASFEGRLVLGGPRPARFGGEEPAERVAERDGERGERGHPEGPRVVRVRQRKTREPPPLLFDLTALQRTANRRFGLSAKRTLDVAQALYERHKLLTYPRTDSRHLPADLVGEMPGLFSALGRLGDYAAFARPLAEAPPRASRRVFDDARVSDHHAIIPTGKDADLARLDRDERHVFDLVVRRFLGAFLPDAEFALTDVLVEVGPVGAAEAETLALLPVAEAPRDARSDERRTRGPGAGPKAPDGSEAGEADHSALLVEEAPPMPDRYLARGRVRLVAGWQEVAGFGEALERRAGRGSTAPAGRESGPAEGDEGEAEPVQALPPLVEGQRLSGAFAVHEKQTRPPPAYSEATLLGAMESAGRTLPDEELRLAMKERGLGTPATRAQTIETLLQRGYLVRRGKQVRATAMGAELIETLPVPGLASAELTGDWEARLARIARGEESRARFMGAIASWVGEVVETIRGARPGGGAPREIFVEPVALPTAAEGRRRGAACLTTNGSRRTARPARNRSPIRPGRDDARTTPDPPAPSRTSEAPRRAPDPGTAPAPESLACPRCRRGHLVTGRRGWGCSRWREGCGFVIWFELEGRRIREAQLRDLVLRGRTRPCSWPRGDGTTGRARLKLRLDGDTATVLPEWA